MAREIVTKSKRFYAVSLKPDICKTPMGNSTPPIPYTIKGEFAQAQNVSPNITSHGDKLVLHDRSTIPTVTGDGPGSATGIKSGTVGKKVETKEKSSTVHTNGTRPVREGDVVKMNDNNTTGKIYERGGEAARPQIQESGSTPPSLAAAEKPASLWDKASPWVHGALGLASFVPGLSVVTSGADAAIYAAEGNAVEAGIAAVGMIPGGKLATTAAKAGKFLKGAQKAEEAAQAARKAEEAAQAARKAEEAAKAAKETKAAKEAEGAAAGGKGKDGGKSKKKYPGPCDHLRQGSGTGPYRGGADSKTSKPANDEKDSHHMPAKQVSPLAPNDGPAIQMDPKDHRMTTSNGNNGRQGAAYRKMIEGLIKNNEWSKALAIEIQDIRRISRTIGEPRKYNEAMLEMLEYFKCLKKNGLLGK